MRGSAVDGLVVSEVLGSGKSGLLYRAEDAARGRAAVLRVRLDEATAGAGFVAEALAHLPPGQPHRHRRGRLGDGTPVEWVVVHGAPLPTPSPSWRVPPPTRPPPSVLAPRPRRRAPPRRAALLAFLAVGSMAGLLAGYIGVHGAQPHRAGHPLLLRLHRPGVAGGAAARADGVPPR